MVLEGLYSLDGEQADSGEYFGADWEPLRGLEAAFGLQPVSRLALYLSRTLTAQIGSAVQHIGQGLGADGYVLVNSRRNADELGIGELRQRLRRERLLNVPASEIAKQHLGRPLPNAALLAETPAQEGRPIAAGEVVIGWGRHDRREGACQPRVCPTLIEAPNSLLVLRGRVSFARTGVHFCRTRSRPRSCRA